MAKVNRKSLLTEEQKALLERLNHLLPQSIWTNLDSSAGPVKVLPPEYEFDFYKKNTQVEENQGYVKYDLFNNDWGDLNRDLHPGGPLAS